MSYGTEVGELLQSIQEHFAAINANEKLSTEDKGQLKEFYLEHLMAPKAQKLFAKYFPEEAAATGDPQRQRKIWIDPNSHSLAFLREKNPSAS